MISRLAAIFLAMVSLAQYVENRGLRQRAREIESEYDKFLATKIGGKPLAERIKPGTFSVFGYKEHRIACAAIGGVGNETGIPGH